jgi:hypothetical protein
MSLGRQAINPFCHYECRQFKPDCVRQLAPRDAYGWPGRSIGSTSGARRADGSYTNRRRCNLWRRSTPEIPSMTPIRQSGSNLDRPFNPRGPELVAGWHFYKPAAQNREAYARKQANPENLNTAVWKKACDHDHVQKIERIPPKSWRGDAWRSRRSARWPRQARCARHDSQRHGHRTRS